MLLAYVLVVGNFQLAIFSDHGAFCWLLLNSNGPKVSGSLQSPYTTLKMGCCVASHERFYWNTWGLKNTLGVYSIHSDNDVTPYGAQ